MITALGLILIGAGSVCVFFTGVNVAVWWMWDMIASRGGMPPVNIKEVQSNLWLWASAGLAFKMIGVAMILSGSSP